MDHPSDFRQKFDASSTALQVLHGKDLSGKVAIVTGSNCGIGFETARSLALHGCTIIMACRNMDSAETAMQKILAEKSDASLDIMYISLEKFSSVKEFVSTFLKKYQRLDLLILNAGVFSLPFSETEDGLETVYQVNYLSQSYLTFLLQDILTRSAPSRVVFVSSESHRFSSMKSGDKMTAEYVCPRSRESYWSMMAYNHSKLVQILFCTKLAQLWAPKGISCFSVHPGNAISTSLARHWWPFRLLFAIVRPFTKSLQQAAATTVYAATSSDLDKVTGLYLNNCFPCETSAPAQDPALIAANWNFTREMFLQAGLKIDM